MPFISGRYHLNPIMGQALEAARAAEAALAARRDPSDDSGYDSDAGDATGEYSKRNAVATTPVHRVEIEAAELVPHSSGRATRGFVVRVHRAATAGDDAADSASANGSGAASSGASSAISTTGGGWRDAAPSASPAPETHVFAGHGDMIDFLRDALDRDTDR